MAEQKIDLYRYDRNKESIELSPLNYGRTSVEITTATTISNTPMLKQKNSGHIHFCIEDEAPVQEEAIESSNPHHHDPNIKITSKCNQNSSMNTHIYYTLQLTLYLFYSFQFAHTVLSTTPIANSLRNSNPIPLILYIFLHILMLYYNTIVAKNPGYIAPKKPTPPPNFQLESNPIEQASPTHTLTKNYCHQCQLYQPIRTRHCRHCKQCVLTFDHHCFFIGGCVGEFNRGKFFAFLASHMAVLLVDMLCAISVIHQEYLVKDWFVNNSTALVFLIMNATMLGIFFSKFIMQTYLLLTSQTAWEYFSRRRIPYLRDLPARALPFSSGKEGVKALFKDAYRTLSHTYRDGYILWTYNNSEGEEVPFNYFDNEYYDCGC